MALCSRDHVMFVCCLTVVTLVFSQPWVVPRNHTAGHHPAPAAGELSVPGDSIALSFDHPRFPTPCTSMSSHLVDICLTVSSARIDGEYHT